ncbi:hypothetical protein MMC26_006006 [Xylographa opegraphella]|nr:hypothetical protein [Xylographa opegraphella]
MFPNIVLSVACLFNFARGLSQEQTNGVSLWGTLELPTFPAFLTSNPLPEGYPWGNKTAKYSNPYKEAPDTGITRYYQFTLSRGQLAPDGYLKNMILVNSQFPGPLIEANWGDYIEVEITNNIFNPEEGTSLHWHGLLQTATPWYDGVPSVQQCPVAPGATFKYRFKADLYGTSWYHSHYSAQYTGGLLGPMVIYGPTQYHYDIDLGPVFLTDYFHKDYFEIVKDIESTNQTKWLQYSDNNLINGKMKYNCSNANDEQPCVDDAPLAQFRFQKGKTHRLRLINAGAAGQQFFSIDDHEMTVIANDYVPLEPYTTTTVFLGVGQRTDVVVRATGNANQSYWMRSNISTICNLPLQPLAMAEIHYEEADSTKHPTTQSWPYTDDGQCANDDLSLTTPYYAITPDPNPAITFEVLVDEVINATGHLEWRMNHQAFHGDYNSPLLLLAQEKNQTYDPEWNVVQPGENGTVRLIINNNSTISHPMHLHGHNMYILHDGDGYWDGHSITNPQNPQRRDTQMLRPGGYIVAQYDADNPGGLYMNILERPNDLTSMKIPNIIQETCRAWDIYSAHNVVDQIDSGLKQ